MWHPTVFDEHQPHYFFLPYPLRPIQSKMDSRYSLIGATNRQENLIGIDSSGRNIRETDFKSFVAIATLILMTADHSALRNISDIP